MILLFNLHKTYSLDAGSKLSKLKLININKSLKIYFFTNFTNYFLLINFIYGSNTRFVFNIIGCVIFCTIFIKIKFI